MRITIIPGFLLIVLWQTSLYEMAGQGVKYEKQETV